MNFKLFPASRSRSTSLVVLMASCAPRPDLLQALAGVPGVTIREAFTTRGVLRGLPGANLVVMDDVMPAEDASIDLLQRTLEMSGVPLTTPDTFLTESEEWLARARLTSVKNVTFLPARQVNLVNWSGGVGKTTLAMSVCKRFVERTGLPAALLELSMGGSALHARVSDQLPDFYTIATGQAEPGQWHGVNLYPMDGPMTEVLWTEDRNRVLQVLESIRKKHTLFVVDAYPKHPLWETLSVPAPSNLILVTTSPRDDALLQARRLMNELPGAHLVVNMAKTLADRSEPGAKVILPHNEGWARECSSRLADPVLDLVYTGWASFRGKGK